jgi:hypothetical protein
MTRRSEQPTIVLGSRVSSPIIFRAQPSGPEHVARPCSNRHRELWLSGFVVASCRKCEIELLEVSDVEA